MDTSEMRCFLMLCTYKNISRAAERLYMSQQGVSNILQRLEKELGCELFRRTRSGLELTACGETAREYVENMFNEYTALVNNLSQKLNESSRLFVVMDLGIFAILTAQPFFGFKQSHPGLSLVIQAHTPLTNNRLLSEDTADLCLALAPYSDDQFNITPICNVEGAILMDKSNDLAKRKALYVDDLRDRPILAFGSATYYPYLRACRRAGFEPNMEISGIELKDPRPYVRGSDGLCPSFFGLLPKLDPDDSLVIVPFQTDLQWSICCMTKKGRKPSKLCDEFMAALREFAAHNKIL